MPHLYYGNQTFDIAQFQDRKVIHELEMAMTALDCVIPDHSGIYCSTDITTGKKLYFEIFKQYNVRSDEELATKLGDDRYTEVKMDLVQSNIERGLAFADGLRLRGFVNIITPAPFIARDFDQEHYLYFWEWVIIKKSTRPASTKDGSSATAARWNMQLRSEKVSRDSIISGGLLSIPRQSARLKVQSGN